MRDTTTISMPEGMLAQLKAYAAKRWFKSLSEYFLFAAKQDQNLMSEDDILLLAEEANRDYNEWKTFTGMDTLKSKVNEVSCT